MKIFRSILISFSLVSAGLGVTTAAHAEKLEGTCFAATKAKFDGMTTKEGHTLSCAKGTWSTLGASASTGDVNGFVELYNREGKSADTDMQLIFRPRKKQECLVSVAQIGQKLDVISNGKNCDTDYKTGVKLKISLENGVFTASGKLNTTTKAHLFSAVYLDGETLGIKGDKNLYSVGLFVADK